MGTNGEVKTNAAPIFNFPGSSTDCYARPSPDCRSGRGFAGSRETGNRLSLRSNDRESGGDELNSFHRRQKHGATSWPALPMYQSRNNNRPFHRSKPCVTRDENRRSIVHPIESRRVGAARADADRSGRFPESRPDRGPSSLESCSTSIFSCSKKCVAEVSTIP